jgi:hypothetical protein
MAIECRTLAEHKLVILKHVGTIPDDEFLDFYKKLFKSDTFDPTMNLLVDLREADSTSRSSEVLFQLAEFAKSTLSDVPTKPKVVVIAPKELSFGLAKMYEAFSYMVPWEFVVFHSTDTALEWLDLPDDLLNS